VSDRHGLAGRVIALLQQHPAVRWARLTGSREGGDTTALSDWDIEVDVDDFESFVTDLRGLDAVVTKELPKLFVHLLRPIGVEEPPDGLTQAVEAYRTARGRAERRFEIRVDLRMEQEVTRALEEVGLARFGATSPGAT
jgi:predicted nucleotidyltransferase